MNKAQTIVRRKLDVTQAAVPLSDLLAFNAQALRVSLMRGGPSRRALRALIDDLSEQAELAFWLERKARQADSQQGRAAA